MADAQREPTFGDHQRVLAAQLAELADRYERQARQCREMDTPLSRAVAADSGDPGLAEIATMMESSAYKVRTLQRIAAEAARNYDAMIAAGGRRNEQAYARFREAMDMLNKLMPSMDHDLGT